MSSIDAAAFRFAGAVLLACCAAAAAAKDGGPRSQLLLELHRIEENSGGLKLLDEVDRGAIKLSQRVEVDNHNLSPGSGELNKTMDPDEPKATNVGDLLEGMMHSSDNTATDHLMAMIGGPKAVTGHLRKLGVNDIDVSRPAALL